jgi:hypothetical protein
MVYGPIAISQLVVARAKYNKSTGTHTYKDLVDFRRIVNVPVKGGKLYIEFADERGRYKNKCYGEVGQIPDFHIVYTFLMRMVKALR